MGVTSEVVTEIYQNYGFLVSFWQVYSKFNSNIDAVSEVVTKYCEVGKCPTSNIESATCSTTCWLAPADAVLCTERLPRPRAFLGGKIWFWENCSVEKMWHCQTLSFTRYKYSLPLYLSHWGGNLPTWILGNGKMKTIFQTFSWWVVGEDEKVVRDGGGNWSIWR